MYKRLYTFDKRKKLYILLLLILLEFNLEFLSTSDKGNCVSVSKWNFQTTETIWMKIDDDILKTII